MYEIKMCKEIKTAKGNAPLILMIPAINTIIEVIL